MISIDLTNLISTIISSTAALVAIIGGFLVSRVITLASEKSSIVRRIREIDIEIDNKEEFIKEVELKLLKREVDEFVEKYAEEVLIENQSIESILEENDSIDLTAEELKPYIEDLYEIYEAIKNAISISIDTTYRESSIPRDFKEFVRDNDFVISKHKDWHDTVYTLLFRVSTRSNSMWGRDLIMPLMLTPPIVYEIRRERIKERNNYIDEIKILTGMKSEYEKLLDEYGSVSGLWSGLLVLAYSTIAGIIVPILLLPYPLGKYDDLATRIFLIILFFTGLISLFIYLGISMYKLTKRTK